MIEQDRIGQGRIEQDRIGQDRTGRDRTWQDRTGHVRSSRVGQIWTGSINLIAAICACTTTPGMCRMQIAVIAEVRLPRSLLNSIKRNKISSWRSQWTGTRAGTGTGRGTGPFNVPYPAPYPVPYSVPYPAPVPYPSPAPVATSILYPLISDKSGLYDMLQACPYIWLWEWNGMEWKEWRKKRMHQCWGGEGRQGKKITWTL